VINSVRPSYDCPFGLVETHPKIQRHVLRTDVVRDTARNSKGCLSGTGKLGNGSKRERTDTVPGDFLFSPGRL